VLELWQALVNLFFVLSNLLVQTAIHWSLVFAWIAWWLCGVNWKKAWRTLAEGAWIPLVLIATMAAAAWSQIAASDCSCLGFVVIPNFWWQLGYVALLVASALFLGWLQGVLGIAAIEINLDPPPHDHGHGDHGHGHDHHHGHEHANGHASAAPAHH
jgi:hypothetical protein